jgi:hypothetical protein
MYRMYKSGCSLAFVLWVWCLSAAGQHLLDRSSFQLAPVFNEEFTYKSTADPQFKQRWDADFYTGLNNDNSEYSPSSQMQMLPGGFIKLHTNRLTMAQRQAATDSAAQHGVMRPAPVPPRTIATASSPNGGSIGYASCKMISKVAVDSLEPATGNGFNGFTYGLFEIRCKLPSSGIGILPAFWLHSPNTEIDIFDNGNDVPQRLLQLGVLDWKKKYSECQGDTATPACWSNGTRIYKHGKSLAKEFNTYSAVWTPQEVTFFFNDQEIFSVPATVVKTHKETARIIINVATSRAAKFTDGDMVIDYVKVWKFRSSQQFTAYRQLRNPPASKRRILN